jgi:hypothetical protein
MFSGSPVYNAERDAIGGFLGSDWNGKIYLCEVSRAAMTLIAQVFGYQAAEGGSTKCICVSAGEVFDLKDFSPGDRSYPTWQLEQILVSHVPTIEKMAAEKVARGDITPGGGISILEIDAHKLIKR